MQGNGNLIAAVAAAAVVGIVGGTITALSITREPTSAPSDAPPSPSASRTALPDPPDSSAPLWSTPTTIHDGERAIEVMGMEGVGQVSRLPQGGYLALTPPSGQEPSFGVYRVRPDGVARLVTFILGRGDVSSDGTRFVGLDLDQGIYKVWRIASGKVVQRIPAGTRPGSRVGAVAAFTPSGVLTGWWDGEQPYVIETSPGQTAEVASGLSDIAVSVDGAYLAGQAANPDPQATSTVCAWVGRLDAERRWRDCDTAFYAGEPRFSPQGSRVLGVPADTDGFGPGAFVVLDSRTGERVATVPAPPLTLEATLLDEETLLVRSALNGDGHGTVISTCDLAGDCVRVARNEAEALLGQVG